MPANHSVAETWHSDFTNSLYDVISPRILYDGKIRQITIKHSEISECVNVTSQCKHSLSLFELQNECSPPIWRGKKRTQPRHLYCLVVFVYFQLHCNNTDMLRWSCRRMTWGWQESRCVFWRSSYGFKVHVKFQFSWWPKNTNHVHSQSEFHVYRPTFYMCLFFQSVSVHFGPVHHFVAQKSDHF